MSTKLIYYNKALRMLGETRLEAVDEERDLRYEMDDVWDDEFIKECLEQGLWNFAMTSVEINYNPSLEPDFGMHRVFDKPSTWCRTAMLCSDPFFQSPLTFYEDQGSKWYCSLDVIYVTYVSDHTSLGLDMSLWPKQFGNYVGAALAQKIMPTVNSSVSGPGLNKAIAFDKKVERLLMMAKGTDAMNEPSRAPATGSLVRSRLAGSRGDRGNRNQLTG